MAQNLYHNLSSFEENGIAKQDKSYKISFAYKNFEYSCKLCCEQNRRRGNCETCPIKIAHEKAITEIKAGLREKPINPNKYHDPHVERDEQKVKGKIHITLTIRFGE